MNTILLSTDETELRASMERLKNETPLDEYFIFGYGAHHIWINQRRPSDKNRIFKHRIMVAHFWREQARDLRCTFTGWTGTANFSPFLFSRQTCWRNTFFILTIKILIQPGISIYIFLFAATLLYKLSDLLQETFSSLYSHIAFGLPDMNCVAKVLVMPFLYARSSLTVHDKISTLRLHG